MAKAKGFYMVDPAATERARQAKLEKARLRYAQRKKEKDKTARIELPGPVHGADGSIDTAQGLSAATGYYYPLTAPNIAPTTAPHLDEIAKSTDAPQHQMFVPNAPATTNVMSSSTNAPPDSVMSKTSTDLPETINVSMGMYNNKSVEGSPSQIRIIPAAFNTSEEIPLSELQLSNKVVETLRIFQGCANIDIVPRLIARRKTMGNNELSTFDKVKVLDLFVSMQQRHKELYPTKPKLSQRAFIDLFDQLLISRTSFQRLTQYENEYRDAVADSPKSGTSGKGIRLKKELFSRPLAALKLFCKTACANNMSIEIHHVVSNFKLILDKFSDEKYRFKEHFGDTDESIKDFISRIDRRMGWEAFSWQGSNLLYDASKEREDDDSATGSDQNNSGSIPIDTINDSNDEIMVDENTDNGLYSRNSMKDSTTIQQNTEKESYADSDDPMEKVKESIRYIHFALQDSEALVRYMGLYDTNNRPNKAYQNIDDGEWSVLKRAIGQLASNYGITTPQNSKKNS